MAEEGTDETILTGEETPVETEAPEWMAEFSDDLKGAECLRKYESAEALAKGHVEVQPLLGLDKIAIPGKDDKDGWDQVFTKLGRPEKADGYELPTENMPQGVEIDDATVKSFHEEAFRMGLNKQQAAALVRWQATTIASQAAALDQMTQKERDEAEAALKAEYADAYDERLRMAKGAIQQFGDKEGKFSQFLEDSGLGNNAEVIRFMVGVGKALGEDEVIGSGGTQAFKRTPADAKAEIDKLMADDNFANAYLGIGGSLAEQRLAKDKMTALEKLAAPEEGA